MAKKVKKEKHKTCGSVVTRGPLGILKWCTTCAVVLGRADV